MTRNTILKLGIFCFLIFSEFLMINNYSQSKGTLTFSTTLAPHNGSYGNNHVVAIWIEDSTNAFVKTIRAKWDTWTKGNYPIAKGLLGKQIGDKVEIIVPAGKIAFEIIEISRLAH